MTTARREAEANANLTTALINAAAQGVRPRCGDGEIAYMFLDENPHVRKVATAYCAGCPVFEPCREVGRYSRFGVFGGMDTTVRLGRPPKNAA